MAAYSRFVIRCKSENGSFLLDDVDNETTVGDLKLKLSLIINRPPGTFKILSGYPPQALTDGTDEMTLVNANINSGETIIIQNMPDSASCSEFPELIDKRSEQTPANQVFGAKGNGPEGDPFGSISGIMMRHVVPSNNSCLFSSVYFVLSNGELNAEKSNELRKVIARVVAENTEKYDSAFLGMSNKDYCKWILNTEHWGGAIELAILSEHFRIEIVAVDTLSLRMHRFGESFDYMNRIFVIYDGIHYDALGLELQSGQLQTIFPTADTFPMEMALEIAREAKSSRQYTDVANFTLRCLKCDAHLRGDSEAREHAIATKHVEFGEINK